MGAEGGAGQRDHESRWFADRNIDEQGFLLILHILSIHVRDSRGLTGGVSGLVIPDVLHGRGYFPTQGVDSRVRWD